MTLRTKILLFLLGVSVAFSAGSFAVQSFVMKPEFARLEQREAQRDLQRALEALAHDEDYLATSAKDYSAWDDTYQYVAGEGAGYEASNLIPETLENQGLDLLAIVRNDGSLVWGRRLDAEGTIAEEPVLRTTFQSPGHPLLGPWRGERKIGGIWSTELGVFLVGSAAITSNDESAPISGAIVMARRIGPSVVAELAELTRLELTLVPAAEASVDAAALDRSGASLTDTSDPNVLRSHALIRDVYGKPALVLSVESPRFVSQRGEQAAAVALGSSVAGAVLLLAGMWFVLARMIASPLLELTAHAVRVGAGDDLDARIGTRGSDEIAVLGREFDRMVERLAQSRLQLIDAAHASGRALVASDVLHNVGNALTGVGVSAGIVSERLESSEVQSLERMARMLADHEAKLAEFLTQDPRGRHVPAFVSELAGHLREENDTLRSEMKALSAALEHIRRVIQAQNEHATGRVFLEPVEPAALMEQALLLVSDSHARHGIRVERRFPELGVRSLDRHRTLQILANLIQNAGHSLKATAQRERVLEVEVSDAGEDRVRFVVRDSGVGIPAENLPRLFQFGFTTRLGGQGIGLHSSANLAGELRGALRAESEGTDRGATFTLELPAARARAAA